MKEHFDLYILIENIEFELKSILNELEDIKELIEEIENE